MLLENGSGTGGSVNYYNDNDPRAAAWLRELIAAGHLPPGTVDERSILEIKPSDLAGFDQCHFFAGIGGWPLALRWAGLEGVAGIWTGSCPCQPLSCAGKRQGHADERHLWPAFHALIAERRPATVFGEQVASKDGREWFAGVRLDLEGLGYACGGADLCAAGVGAPHRRQWLFWVADSNVPGCDQRARGGQQPIRNEDLRLDTVADTGHVGQQHKTERQGRGNDDGCGEAGRVAHPADGGQRREPDGKEGRGESGCDCGMGDATSRGRGVGGDEAQPGRGGHTDLAGWARCDILPCRDGKARRVEDGTFPLADGIPGRMGLLRGYGNAIVPQAAAEFVMAWAECSLQPNHTLCDAGE